VTVDSDQVVFLPADRQQDVRRRRQCASSLSSTKSASPLTSASPDQSREGFILHSSFFIQNKRPGTFTGAFVLLIADC
jgi:hypothetical protein